MTGIGHLSSAFLLKSKFKETPIWILLIGAEVVELLWVLLNLNPFGFSPALEFMKIEIPFLYIGDMKLLSQQYSHSLFGGVAIGIVFFFLLKFFEKNWTLNYLPIALIVSGHWCLDFLVHDHDLQIFPLTGSMKVGPLYSFDLAAPELGISATIPLLGFSIQACFSLLCVYVFLRNFRFTNPGRKKVFLIGIVVLNLFALPIFIKGCMTFLIKSENWMAFMVLADMVFSGVLLFYLSKTSISNTA
ncbi:hypothetical protein EHO60_08340 [Leptospira fletcheri]|uniref:Metal-dependent hydrolase n=2 Tax=Leptospira fletcheri TaxID=2484981 RepID=A0A4R9GIR2_9LEPT|nr:hypothetical protein EHO60_08340 [Leptospira fletcheri]